MRFVTSPKGKRILDRLAASSQLYVRYDGYKRVAQRVIAEIDKAYPGAARN